MGGRLSFDRSKKHKRNPNGENYPCCGDRIKPSNGEDRDWRMTMPTNCSKQLNSHDISTFDGLHCCRFQHGCHCWPHVWHGLDKGKNGTDKQIVHTRDELSVHPCASILDHLEGVVGAESEGDSSRKGQLMGDLHHLRRDSGQLVEGHTFSSRMPYP